MGKILEYPNLGAAPADNDLLFMGDYSADNSNPATKRLAISDLNKKRNVDAADGNGLKLRDDGSNYGILIHDGGNIGVGPGAATTPGAFLAIRGNTDANLNLLSVLNPSATTDGRYSQMLFGIDAANYKSVSLRYYYDTTNDDGRLSISHYEDAGTAVGIHLKGDGNVGIGTSTPSAELAVETGDVLVLDKDSGTTDYGIQIDASRADLKGVSRASGGSVSNGTLHVNRNSGGDVYFMYNDTDGSTVNPAMKIESSNKHVGIGNITGSISSRRVHIKEDASDTNPVLTLQNTTSSGHAGLELNRNNSAAYITWNGSLLTLTKANEAGNTSATNKFNVTATTGNVGIGTATTTYKLNVAAASSTNIVGDFITADTAGARILLETGTSDAAATYSSVVGFPLYESSTKKVNWMAGAMRLSSTNYFGIHYKNTSYSDSAVSFDGTLANNLFYIDTSGNTTIKGNIGADAYYDKGGTTVGNYCRGRFVQTFSIPYKILTGTQTYSPLFSTPVDTTGAGAAAGPITAKFATAAPHDGRIQSVRIAARNASATDDCNVDMYIYSQAALPDETAVTANSLTTVTSANFQNAKIEDTGTAKNTIITKGYADFTAQTDTSTYPRAKLDFNQGDYLAFMIEADSGSAEATVTLTVEFYIDDTL